MSMRSAFRRVSAWADRRPRAAALCSGLVLASAGDGIAQKVEDKADDDGINLKRLLAMGSYSALFGALIYVPFYYALDKHLGPRRVLMKTALDCGVMASFVDIPAWFAWTGWLEGRSAAGSMDRFRAHYTDTMLATWALWVPLTLANFSLVPLHFRVPVGFCGEFVWAIAASYISHREEEEEEKEEEEEEEEGQQPRRSSGSGGGGDDAAAAARKAKRRRRGEETPPSNNGDETVVRIR